MLRYGKANVARLAQAFREAMQRDFTPLELAWVDAVNEQSPDYLCASHDLCDASETMCHAFELTFGRPCDIGNNQTHLDLWEAAWSLAKAQGFGLGRTLGAKDAGGNACEPDLTASPCIVCCGDGAWQASGEAMASRPILFHCPCCNLPTYGSSKIGGAL
jgi:hypothetical protein